MTTKRESDRGGFLKYFDLLIFFLDVVVLRADGLRDMTSLSIARDCRCTSHRSIRYRLGLSGEKVDEEKV